MNRGWNFPMNAMLPIDAAAAPACPVLPAAGIGPDDGLRLAFPKRMVVQRRVEGGVPALHLYYGDKEISFDDERLFAFGETLARQSEFTAGDAIAWGDGYAWDEIAPLLAALLAEGILAPAGSSEDLPVRSKAAASPLPPAPSARVRTWAECEAITTELAGRPVELGHLELVVPVFRVAHIAIDADGRHVGEANTFPRALRTEIPTEWARCPFPGTRHDSDRPMNLTAMKAMRAHWPQMMAALRHIRGRFVERFPSARAGWTVAHVERLATLVLAVPTFQLMRQDLPAAEPLHPALASLFRVTDGLRMATHQMMFVPVGEPALPPDTPVTAETIHDYAERNYSFHSDTGVCSGPAAMIREFLSAVLGEDGVAASGFAFDPAVAAALADIDAAFDYGIRGLRAHAALFSVFPAMGRSYERLATALADAGGVLAPAAERMARHLVTLRRTTFVAREEWRADRESAYAAIFGAAGEGLHGDVADLPPVTTFVAMAPLAEQVRDALRPGFLTADQETLFAVATAVAEFAGATQRIIAAAEAEQSHVNRILSRPQPARSFASADIAVHGRLLGPAAQRLPFLLEEVADVFGLAISVTADRVEIGPAQPPVPSFPSA